MRMNEKIMNYKFDGSRVFFTSDTHFNHTNIIRFCNRPFKDVSHMNETIISNWNRVVGPEDIVFHLGDFCLGGSAEWVNVLNRQHTEQAERENIPYFRQPRHQEPEAELHEILRADSDADVY